MKRLIPKTKRIELKTKGNLKDYFYLTMVIAIGLLGSIFAFVVSTSFVYRESFGSFNAEVMNLHANVSSTASRESLEFEYLSKAIQNVAPEVIKARVKDSLFSCVHLVNINNSNDNIIFKKGSATCADKKIVFGTLADPKSQKTFLAEIRASEIILSTIVEKSGWGFYRNKKLVLVAVLPFDSLFQKLQLSGDMALSLTEPSLLQRSYVVKKIIQLDGKEVPLYYWPSNNQLNINMRWPWTVLAAGLIVTVLLGTMIYNLIGMNIEILKEVEKKTEALQAATTEAMTANLTKTRFLANVSHEVRTPLNLILGMADLLLETTMHPDQKKYVETFRRAGTHLLDIINDILEVARIEVHESTTEPVEFDLIALVEGVSDIMTVGCRSKKITFDFNISPKLPRAIKSNPKYIRQILINLINNSMKFTDSGGIVVDIGYKQVAEGHSLQLTVKDTGIGIPKDQIDKVYESFFQVDASSKRSRGGVGLGLHIVKMCVDNMGGKIQLESTLGKGTAFSVEIPIQPVSQLSWTEDLTTQMGPQGSKILLVTPNRNQAEFISNSLQVMGYKVSTFYLASEALKALKKASFDYCLFDLVGEDLGAIEIMERLKRLGKSLKNVVVLCPPIYRANDFEVMKSLGVERLCYTPVKIRNLMKCFHEISGGDPSFFANPESKSVSYKGEKEPEKKRLLIAEDDEDNRYLLQAYLGNSNFEITFAVDGAAAFEQFKNKTNNFDMLITDIQMPKMDGLELIQAIRRWEAENQLPRIPIVALTADAQKETAEKVRSLGGDDSLTKPISKTVLLATIAKH